MQDLDKMTIAALKAYASETHGLSFKSKALKADIIAAIEDAERSARPSRPAGDAFRMLIASDREGNYIKQNGTERLTARQNRRVNKKFRHALENSSEYKLTRAL